MECLISRQDAKARSSLHLFAPLRLGARSSNRVRLILSAGLLLSGALGCTQHREIISASSVPPNAKIVKAEELPKQTPKATSCVAYGNLRLQTALDGSVQGTQRDTSLEDARKYYSQALSIDPKCIDAYLGLAQVEQAFGNYEGALARYRKGLAVDAKQAPLWYEMGICQARHGDWPAAQESVNKACDLDADNRLYVKTLAFCLAKNGHYDDSVAWFKRIMDEGQAHYNVARLLHHDKQEDLSRLHLQLALQANPKLTVAQNFLAQLDGRPAEPSSDVAAAPAPNVGIDIDDLTGELTPASPSAN